MAETVYSDTYKLLHDQISLKQLTEPEAKKMIAKLYGYKMLSDDECDLLMAEANELSANTDYGDLNNQITELKEKISAIEERLSNVEQAVKDGSTTIPEPEPGATGTEFDPITAYAGMMYYKDKYYKDPKDNQIYQCFRDSDTDPGSGVRLDFIPSQLVNIYFYFVRVS